MLQKSLILILFLALSSSSFSMEVEAANSEWGILPSELKQIIAEYLDDKSFRALTELNKETNDLLQKTKAERIIQYNVYNPKKKASLIEYLKRVKAENRLVAIGLPNATNQDLRDLEPYLDCIKHLDLSYTRVTNMNPLVNCINLHYIDLSGTTKITDRSPLDNIKNLHSNFGDEHPIDPWILKERRAFLDQSTINVHYGNASNIDGYYIIDDTHHFIIAGHQLNN